MKTYSKKKSGDGMIGPRPEEDKFDRAVAMSSNVSQSSSLNTRPFDSVQKSGQMTEEMSDYTWTWTYTYGTGSSLTARGADLSPIEVPRREQPERESIGISDLILPNVEDELDEKIQRWLQNSQNESPEHMGSIDPVQSPIKEKEPVQRSQRMNSTLLDSSRAQNAEDAMQNWQGISTIYEDEETFHPQSRSIKKVPKGMQQVLETTPRVIKKSRTPGTPAKTEGHGKERQGFLKPKKAELMFGAPTAAENNNENIESAATQKRTVKGQPVQDGIVHDAAGKEEADQHSPQWVSFRERPEKKSAQTSTPRRRGNFSDHLKMFSVELSSVNPGNETGVDLPIYSSRFVNSKEIITESDYLNSLSAAARTISGLQPIQEKSTNSPEKDLSKKIKHPKNIKHPKILEHRDDSLTKKLSKMSIDVFSVPSLSEDEQACSAESYTKKPKSIEHEKSENKLTSAQKKRTPIRQERPKRIQPKRKVANTRSNKTAPRKLASTMQRKGMLPKINLSAKKKKSTPKKKTSNSKVNRAKKLTAKKLQIKEKRTHELTSSLGEPFTSPPELPRWSRTGRISARRERLGSYEPPAFTVDIIEGRGDEVSAAIEMTSSVPICCLTLFDEDSSSRKPCCQQTKVDYQSIIAGVPQDCLELFDY